MAYTKSNTTNVSFTTTSTSHVLSTKAKEVVLSATADCYVSFDSTVTTATNGFYVAKDRQCTIHILFPAQISVIRKSADGVLSVLELGDSLKELRVTYSATLTGDTNLKTTVASSYTGNSNLKREYEFTGNANLKGEYDFTGDSNLEATNVSDTFTGNANLKREYEFTGDAVIMTGTTGSITGDANLKATDVSATFVGDTNLKATDIHPNTFHSDALLVTL